MQLPRTVLLAILLPFALYSSYVTYQVGYLGIWTSHFHLAGMQVLIDLVIACTLTMVWMWRDATANDRNVWPYLAMTLAFGTFGPVSYLLLAPQPPFATKALA